MNTVSSRQEGLQEKSEDNWLKQRFYLIPLIHSTITSIYQLLAGATDLPMSKRDLPALRELTVLLDLALCSSQTRPLMDSKVVFKI